jgi:hypothetical protein
MIREPDKPAHWQHRNEYDLCLSVALGSRIESTPAFSLLGSYTDRINCPVGICWTSGENWLYFRGLGVYRNRTHSENPTDRKVDTTTRREQRRIFKCIMFEECGS